MSNDNAPASNVETASASEPTTFGANALRRATGGLAIRSGIRAGKAKTSDKAYNQMMDYIKG